MKRIFEGLGNKEESEWWGSEGFVNLRRGRGNLRGRGRGNRGRDGRNPVNREGRVTQCAICRSEWHWARECPENIQNKKKVESSQEKEEKVYIGRVSTVDEESWEEIDAILDTGCKSTVCGEL